MPDHAVVSDFCALRISLTLFSQLSATRLLAWLIVAPQRGYDEPGILSYAISSFCPTSADGLHPPGYQEKWPDSGIRPRSGPLERRKHCAAHLGFPGTPPSVIIVHAVPEFIWGM